MSLERSRMQIGRRSLFLSTTAGMVVVAASGRATAFMLQEAPADVEEAYHRSCGDADAYHAALRERILSELEGNVQESAEVEAILAAMDCPLCGCALNSA